MESHNGFARSSPYQFENSWNMYSSPRGAYDGRSGPNAQYTSSTSFPAADQLASKMQGIQLGGPGLGVSNWTPEKQQWLYLDPSGNVQGPFSGIDMQAWYEQQYLYMELMVRRIEESSFRPLYTVLQEVGDSVAPFLVPPAALRAAPSRSPHPSHRDTTGPLKTEASDGSYDAPGDKAGNDNASDPKSDELAAAFRMLKQLEAMLIQKGAPDAQITQMLQQAIVAAMPNASAKEVDQIQSNMRDQRSQYPANQREGIANAMTSDSGSTATRTGTDERTETTADAASHPVSEPIHNQNNSGVQPESTGGSNSSVASERAIDSNAAGSTGAALETKPKSRRAAKREAQAAREAQTAGKGMASTIGQEIPPRPSNEAVGDAQADRASESVKTETQTQSLRKSEPAPWALPDNKGSAKHGAPSLREVLQREERERNLKLAQEKASAAARLAQEMTSQTASTASPTRPTSGAPWNVTNQASSAKSLSQIQKEESLVTQRNGSAAPSRSAGYSNSALRGANSSEPARQNEPWSKVGANGKSVAVPVAERKPAAKSSLPLKPAPQLPTAPVATPAALLTNVQRPAGQELEEGWVTKKSKGQVRRDALTEMNDGIPRPTGAPAGLQALNTPRSQPSSTPLPPSPQFLRYCREQLKDVQANIDEFLDMLLSFPLNPTPDVEEIIAEAVYANSKTLDGRRFATDFVSRRKKDAFRAVAL
ncbi:hypothetical protein MPSI1_000698 [Malassezia psittaci]|uniref:GYF domain-containing protein n=1 Tax=Malassezia psittaci TaxID=1821823 RepID=A0AAF0JIW8_9BASI|nr:hypothetical protein MPSI1_000698 [Malassezia psittaci]